jgi:(p)ppGpp synthase/HD superfamily hydrolase
MYLDLSHKPIAAAALQLATEHHKGVYRKYSCKPYIEHPKAVANILLQNGHYDQDTLAAAFLHDCMEDENLEGYRQEAWYIENKCNAKVARWVKGLTDTETGNRAERKQASIKRLMTMPCVVREIKMADIMDNIKDIVEQDPSFAPQYLAEKRTMLEAFAPSTPGPMIEAAMTLLKRCDAKAAHLTIEAARKDFEKNEAKRIADAEELAFMHSILAEEENSFINKMAMF